MGERFSLAFHRILLVWLQRLPLTPTAEDEAGNLVGGKVVNDPYGSVYSAFALLSMTPVRVRSDLHCFGLNDWITGSRVRFSTDERPSGFVMVLVA